MNFYYDIVGNMNEESYEFYEWEEEDHLVSIKKVPFVRVSDQDMHSFLQYKIVFDLDFLKPYFGKTLLRKSKAKENYILFSSTTQSLLVEFNMNGEEIRRSRLLIEDENNCNEIASSLLKSTVSYQLLSKIHLANDFRQALEEKHVIQEELKNILENHNVSKCTYLYYEWFGHLEEDFSLMVKKMQKELEKEYTLKIHDIVKLIQMSYKERL